MRKLLLPAVLLASSFAAAQSNLRAPIVVTPMDFKAVVSDGRVVCSWKRYKRDDFFNYRLIKSQKPDPQWPETVAVYNSDLSTDLRFEDGKLSPGTWFYRLVIVTKFGDRWVSPAVQVMIGDTAMKRAAPTAADFEGI